MAMVACHACSATYDNPKLTPGTQFACGKCGEVLTVPDEDAGMLILEPLEPEAPASPPPAPPEGRPQPPVVQPRAQQKPQPPVVQPKAQQRPQPPVVRPKAQPRTPPGSAAPAQPPARKAAPGPKAPGVARRPAQAPRRRPATAEVAQAQQTTRAVQQPAKKGIPPLVLAGSLIGVVVVIVLVIVMMQDSGPTEAQKTEAYTAGFLAGHKNLIEVSFGERQKKDTDLYVTWSRGKEDTSELDFLEGVRDARGRAAPRVAREEIDPRRFRSELVLKLMDTHFPYRTAEGALKASERFEEEKARWEGLGAPKKFVKMLEKQKQKMLAKVLEHDPDHAELRKIRGEVKYENQLLEYVTAGWLERAEQLRAKRTHDFLEKKAARNAGWVPQSDFDRVGKLADGFASAKKAYEEMMSSGFGAKALEMAKTVTDEVNEIYAKARDWPSEEMRTKNELTDEVVKQWRDMWLKNIDKRTFTYRIQKPYVVFVEEDDSWDPSKAAKDFILQPLNELNETFLKQYQKKHKLKDLTDPIPVIFLRNKMSYMQYMIGQNGAPNQNVLAHFEPKSGRLVLNGDTEFTTKLHEGTHQLFFHYTRNTPSFTEQSFWFNEGVAEWFSGARRTPNPQKEGAWQYEIGLLQVGRFKSISSLFGRKERDKPGLPLSLGKLLTCTYATRSVEPWTMGQVYAQGWMLIYFLNYFNVDADGYVQIDTKKEPVDGIYKDGWERYVGMELNGKTGKAAFMEALKLDDKGLEKMSDEFEKYQKWILRKINLRQVKEKRLVPALEWRTRSGKLGGLKEDDLLVPPKKTDTDDE